MTNRPLIILLGNDYDETDHAVLFPEVRRRGADIERVHPDELVTELTEDGARFFFKGEEISPDLVVGWVYEDILYRGMYQLEAFERMGVPVLNTARTLFCGQNKYLNSVMLHAAGVPHLRVLSGRDGETLLTWARSQSFPLVLKPIVGFGGNGLQKIESMEQLAKVAPSLAPDEHYYIVPFVDNPGRDIRVYCLNYEPVYAHYRYAPEGQWITNFSAGGSMAPCNLTPELMEIAARASRSVGARMSGVDVVEDQATGTLRIFEVNTCPSNEPPVLPDFAQFLVEAATDYTRTLDSWKPEHVLYEPKPTDKLFHDYA
ncbi:ATP-grasp domain-containing protein [Micromonospora sp. KLBMP9576]|uniref:ATP-grasp domain-containing protein n=1 Tax=Micromonospora sp. KLBMP9576 TaxID=3424769 RepID=UPI003D8CA53E